MYEAYAAVERSYSQGRYDEALNQAQGLLASLGANPEDPLRPRLLLLVGHCHLYGLADPQRAASAYQEVLDHCREPVLREIAEQGLGRCTIATPAASTPLSSPTAVEASPAMPWLSQIGTSTAPAPTPQAAFAPFQAPAATPTTPAPDPAPEIRAERRPEPRPEPVQSPRPAPQSSPEPQERPIARRVVQPDPEPEPIAPSEPELIIPELMAEPQPPARPSSAFTREEEEDLARGLLLVEL